LVELLAQSRTAARTLSALEEAASGLSYRDTDDAANLAWEISECHLAAHIFDAEHVAKGIVMGGLRVRERHGEIVRLVRSLLADNKSVAEAVEDELWLAVGQKPRNSNDVVGLGAARVLIEAGCPSVRDVMVDDDYKTEKRAVGLIKTLLAGSPDETFTSEALRKLVDTPDLSARARKSLVLLLKEEDDDTAYAAARYLIVIGDSNHRDVPTALVRGGLTHYARRDEAARMLDELRSAPLACAAVWEALQQATWSENDRRAWTAAVYLMDRVHVTDTAVARGLVFGGIRGHGPREGAEMRVRTLLTNPASRDGALNTLRALLIGEDRGYMPNVASLLVLAGEPLCERIMREFDSEFVARHSPFIPLAVLALSGRVDEARERARTLDLRRLLNLLGDEPFPLGCKAVPSSAGSGHLHGNNAR
jgi:hypothetical protein